jgi:maltose alpha-D-glucosyltransferase/alpha-amylase
LGQTPFPPIGELPYLLTLPGYGFYWFKLSREAAAPTWHEERLPREDVPVLVLTDSWASFFPERVAAWRAKAARELRAKLEERLLPVFVAAQRWFAGKSTAIAQVRVADYLEWDVKLGHWMLAIIDVESGAETTQYFLPLVILFEDAPESRWLRLQPAAIARVRQQAAVGVLAEASVDEGFCGAVIEAIGAATELATEHGRLHFAPTARYAQLRGDPAADLATGVPLVQGSNTTLKCGTRLFLKLYRRLQAGVNPEVEIGRFLTDVAHFSHIAAVAGVVEYRRNDGEQFTLALLHAFVPNQGDAWEYTINYLARFLEDLRTSAPVTADTHGAYLALMRTLGTRTAQLHCALATPTDDPAFGVSALEAADFAALRTHMQQAVESTFSELEGALERLPAATQTEAAALLSRRAQLLSRISATDLKEVRAVKTRTHGDYHLGQVLLVRNDFAIVDFEGEPARPLAERREKQSPLRDVAGMLRSFAYARHAALQRVAAQTSEDTSKWEALLEAWEHSVRDTFLTVYDGIARSCRLYESFAEVQPLLDLFEIDKALYELRYELGNRPDWALIPLRALIAMSA